MGHISIRNNVYQNLDNHQSQSENRITSQGPIGTKSENKKASFASDYCCRSRKSKINLIPGYFRHSTENLSVKEKLLLVVAMRLLQGILQFHNLSLE